MRISIVILSALLLAPTTPLRSTTYVIKANGTGDHPTIQAAIDAGISGDTILLADGVFTGDGNWDLDFGGRSIVVKSEGGIPSRCTIHCQNGDAGYHRSFHFHSGETYGAVVEGITIQGGYIREGYGGGILIENISSPTVKNCTIMENAIEGSGVYTPGYTYGGGIAILDSSPLILNNHIRNNNTDPPSVTDYAAGGGIYIQNGSPNISGNHIYYNVTRFNGGGIYSGNSAPVIANNHIEGNDAYGNGGGIFITGDAAGSTATIQNNVIMRNEDYGIYCVSSEPEITNNTIMENKFGGLGGSGGAIVTNCVFYRNTMDQIRANNATVTYCWVEGGYAGTGNINGTAIPFQSGPQGTYYLPDDHECVDAGSDLASNLCFSVAMSEICMNRLTIRTDQKYDTGQVDIGYHYLRVPWTYRVPEDFETIQDAIDYAIKGDTIIVGPGFFNENINFLGKKIYIEGTIGYLQTTLLGDGTGPAVTFDSGETSNTTLSRFIITGGTAPYGGGIYIRNSSPRVEFCEVEGNYATYGGGIYCYNSAAVFMTVTVTGNEAVLGGGMYVAHSGTKINNCTITDNVANGNESGIMGGGIYIDASIPYISYTVIARNHAMINYGDSRGGGIYCSGSALSPTLSHCTFYRNLADAGSGIEIENCSITITNTIIAQNELGEATRCSGTGGASLTSCNVYGNDGGNWTGCIAGQDTTNNNMSEDPIFCDAGNDDFHISSASPCAPANNPGSVLIGARTVQCYPATYEVHPNGSGSFAAIQDAVDHALGGQTIELGDGTYSGTGNRDIDFKTKSITVRSRNRDPDSCIIDCGGSDADPHQGFVLKNREGAGARIEGVTIANAHTTKTGGGVQIFRSSPVIHNCLFTNCFAYNGGGLSTIQSAAVITNCRFLDNTALFRGGAISNYSSHPTIKNCAFLGNRAEEGGAINNHPSPVSIIGCTFARNSAAQRGGGVFNSSSESSPTIYNCTFSQNAAPYGGGIYSRAGANPTIYNTIIAFSMEGEAVYCGSEAITDLYCCDIFGNVGGDYIGCIVGQNGANDNFSLDPLFCDTLEMNYHLHENSPCAEEINAARGLVGAHGTACEPFVPPPPTANRLYQCYPNPFNAGTRIAFDISKPAEVSLRIYDVAGHLVHVLVEKRHEPGRYEEVWDGRDSKGNEVASGVYFYRLTAGSFTESKKIVLLR